MQITELIQKKRDNLFLPKEEINFIVSNFSNGTIPEYQMSALLMAIYINGMSYEEISYLTESMLFSGEVIEHNSKSAPIIDKHSTGGVGDKISIPLAPAVAACGIVVPMIAGRGLGHTGGTLDKLESIPGFRCNLSVREFKRNIEQIGCAIMGQTEEIAPADKKMYALRDVTATVESIPLIASSIMSKKLAEGLDGLVLDVKYGSGAFMKEFEKAKLLATTMVSIGQHMKKSVTALLTNMDQPLGRMVGNTLEIIESVQILHGDGPKDSQELTIELGAEMILLGKKASNLEEAREKIRQAINSGLAFEKFLQMVEAQGGDISYINDIKKLSVGPKKDILLANNDGFISSINNYAIGTASVILGGGRNKLFDPIDHRVGIEMHVKLGDAINKNDPICTIFHNDKGLKEAKMRIKNAITIDNYPNEIPKLFACRISNN